MLNHLAIIMDGNGRWAKAKGWERTRGHKQGAQTVRCIALEANRLGIKVLTLYAFSTENWKRPPKEVEYLCKLPQLFFNKYINELNRNNIKVRYIGELDKFPKDTISTIENAVEQTKNNTGLELVFAINYGSQRELTLAARKYAQDVVDQVCENTVDEVDFSKYLMTYDLGPVDLLIRTSGEKRLSNFLLWQVAYSEFIFVDYPWPELNEDRFRAILDEYEQRNRRYGGL